MEGNGFAWSESREWLAANGLGGYASSTLIGLNTRKYHGLLVPAFSPEDRRVMLSKIDEEITISGQTYKLSTNQYWDAIEPMGFQHLRSFSLNPNPTFTYEVPGARIEKTVFMPRYINAVVVGYTVKAENPKEEIDFGANFLATSRDIHWVLKNPEWKFKFSKSGDMAVLTPGHKKPPSLCIGSTLGSIEKPDFGDNIVRDVFYRTEMERGYPHLEDLFICARLKTSINGRNSFHVICTSDLSRAAAEQSCRMLVSDPGSAEKEEIARKKNLVDAFYRVNRIKRADAVTNLVTASDAFVIKKGKRNAIIAGYPWFGEWGRDSLISLPGLCVTTGRKKEAESILVGLAEEAKAGILPNHFIGSSNYDSADTSLWLFWAVEKYLEHTGDYSFVKKRLWGPMKEIVRRYSKMCGLDGLVDVGSEKPMTWMDAVVDGNPVTLRSGKPVEVEALWFNALTLVSRLAKRFGTGAGTYSKAAELCKKSFNEKFWNGEKGYLFDVVGKSNDASIRPNALFAISLPFPVLEKTKWRSVVNVAISELLTPYGMRTLATSDPCYRGSASGNPGERDLAYHQGDAWPWLLGAFIDAYGRAYPHKRLGMFTETLLNKPDGIPASSISEVFSGSYPHKPDGCLNQAWSVGELMRVIAENP